MKMRVIIKSNKVVREAYEFVKDYNYKVILEKDTIWIDDTCEGDEELDNLIEKFGCEVELETDRNYLILNVKD